MKLNKFRKSQFKTKLYQFLNRDIEKVIFVFCLFLSIIFHTLYLSLSKINEITFSKSNVKKDHRIKLILKSRKFKTKIKKKQIVETEKSNIKKHVDSKFLGEKNNYFEKVMVSKKVGKFKKYIKSYEETSAQKNQKRKKLTLANLGMKKFLKSKLRENKVRKRIVGNNGASNDFIEDLPLGDMTHLNTTEYKFYGFYHRIKQKLEQHWGKSVQEKMNELYRRNGRMPASITKITSLIVDLDQMGNITNITLKGSSGISELDQAAIDSFNKAGPFPNPPKGMLKNGLATIEWGFVLKG